MVTSQIYLHSLTSASRPMIVDNGHRRRGIGTEMLAAAEKALAKAGCRQVEAMSDISISNSHNFFRSLNFEQTSYRFVRGIDE